MLHAAWNSASASLAMGKTFPRWLAHDSAHSPPPRLIQWDQGRITLVRFRAPRSWNGGFRSKNSMALLYHGSVDGYRLSITKKRLCQAKPLEGLRPQWPRATPLESQENWREFATDSEVDGGVECRRFAWRGYWAAVRCMRACGLAWRPQTVHGA
ncbi:hypothetical protein K438DRAFT_1754131 [Mycena galopus ATCC 62051]|nr:hypothetical protein K438DRAFT_1754131 [Mycena galopus ATCC 62051]